MMKTREPGHGPEGRRKALIVRATLNAEFCELDSIRSAFTYEGIDVEVADLTQPGGELDDVLESIDDGGPWSFVYVCAHGNESGFGDDAVGVSVEWGDFSDAVCQKLEPGCNFMAACCRGGFNEVAFQIFDTCDSVDAVVGPQFYANSGDLRIGFATFLHHVENRRNDPTKAADAASMAAGIQFKLFDRLETTNSRGYFRWTDRMQGIESGPAMIQSAA